MVNELVTVIVPVYNTIKYLRECVNSIVNQTYSNLEILLIDDGSTDKSLELCYQFEKKDNRIRVIHKNNEGLGLTRNKGLEFASGKYVCFIDSDDAFRTDHIESLVKAYEDNETELVMGSYTKCDRNGNELKNINLPFCGCINKEDIKNKLMLMMISAEKSSPIDLGLPMSVCFNLYLLKKIKDNNLKFISERITACEDLFFNLSYLNLIDSVVLVNNYGYKYRFNPNSITKGFDKKQIERMERFHFELLDTVKKIELKQEAIERVYRCDLAKLRSLLFMIVRSDLSYINKNKLIKSLISKNIYVKALNEYPISYYRTSLKITSYLMKYKKVNMLHFVLYLKEKSVNRK